MKLKTLSVCFADQTNFNKLLETVGELETVDKLKQAFHKIGDIVVRHHGTIRKYIGDAVMFTFEEPKEAIAAANEIATQIREQVQGIELVFTVSVATGEVIVTDIGHPSFTMEDVFGKIVNHAAMLMEEAEKSGTRVAFCDETKKSL
jgi:adenylate cyclase